MELFKNNYFQSEEFRSLNEEIFKYKIINIKKNNFFILRNNFKNNKSFSITKSEIGTELRGFLEFFGQPVDFNSDNYKTELKAFLKETSKIIKEYNPGITIFRAVDIKNKNQYEEVRKIFLENSYTCRPWESTIIDIDNDNDNEGIKISNYNTRREIKQIKKLKVSVNEIKNFNEYEEYIKYFFQTHGHKNYPNKKKYLHISAWQNLKLKHNFFILKIDNIPYAVFGVRIYVDRAYWCMVGRIKEFKHSLHAFSMDYLYQYLKYKNINFFDIAGYNPSPKNKKEEGIKLFKEKFDGNMIYQPSFILDNTSLIKAIRSGVNYFRKTKSYADESLF